MFLDENIRNMLKFTYFEKLHKSEFWNFYTYKTRDDLAVIWNYNSLVIFIIIHLSTLLVWSKLMLLLLQNKKKPVKRKLIFNTQQTHVKSKTINETNCKSSLLREVISYMKGYLFLERSVLKVQFWKIKCLCTREGG